MHLFDLEWSRDDGLTTNPNDGSGRPGQRSLEQWAALLKEHEASGQSQRENWDRPEWNYIRRR